MKRILFSWLLCAISLGIVAQESENKEIINKLIDSVTKEDSIPLELYSKYNVKRGLRNTNGTGVLVGLTAIAEVHGYMIEDSDKIPSEGKLLYRGYLMRELLSGAYKESRYAFNFFALSCSACIRKMYSIWCL